MNFGCQSILKSQTHLPLDSTPRDFAGRRAIRHLARGRSRLGNAQVLRPFACLQRAAVLTGIAIMIAAVPAVPALEAARMALPAELQAANTRLAATGFGGRNKGTYVLGGLRGQFTRGESRLGIFDPLYVSNKGKSSFTLEDADGNVSLTASCRMSKGTATIGVVTFDPKKMSYTCEFEGSDALAGARLALGQPKPEGMKERMLAKDRRRGEATLLGEHFVINSVHEYAASKFGSQAPLGYLVESGGDIVAAVDLLDWNPIVFLRPDAPESLQRATLAVALALAVLRDPANSALED